VVAALRLVAMFAWILVGLPFQLCFYALRLPQRILLPIFFHTIMMRVILGIRIETRGVPAKGGPILFIANHMSYLDVLAVGSLVPAGFVSKAEVGQWFFISLLAKLQDSVFIERNAKSVAQQTGALAKNLREKRNLVLFPEGTSTDGRQLKPFKSSLLQVLWQIPEAQVRVQPISIACSGTHGQQHRYPWIGEMTLAPHLWNILQTRGLRLCITFHPVLPASHFPDRKSLAHYAQTQVACQPVGVVDETVF